MNNVFCTGHVLIARAINLINFRNCFGSIRHSSNSLSATDKQAIRGVFLRWSQEIIERGYHHPEPVGMVNDPALLRNRDQVRWAGNNYFTGHMR